MRVALFFDGKNHMKDLRRASRDRWLDHGALAEWTVKHVGGARLVAAYYYTGVPNPQDEAQERRALTDLLEELERRPGFFVRRFNRRATTRECPHCNQMIAYTEEKMVDTSLVADVITLGMTDAFDVAVIFSGDLDLAPALSALHTMGKQGWIATFGEFGMSRALVRQAWSRIDLLEHIDRFAYPELTDHAPRPSVTMEPEEVDRELERELKRAQAHFVAGGGFVGAHYFLHRWKGHSIPESSEDRRESLQRLMAAGRVETYVVDGKTALRVADRSEGGLTTSTVFVNAGGDDEETVEMRVTEAVRRLRAKLKD